MHMKRKDTKRDQTEEKHTNKDCDLCIVRDRCKSGSLIKMKMKVQLF